MQTGRGGGSLSCVCTSWAYQLWGQCFIHSHTCHQGWAGHLICHRGLNVCLTAPGFWYAVKIISKCPQTHLVTGFLPALGKSYNSSKMECIFISGRQSSPPSLINSSFPWMLLTRASSRILKRQRKKEKKLCFWKAWPWCFVSSSLEIWRWLFVLVLLISWCCWQPDSMPGFYF